MTADVETGEPETPDVPGSPSAGYYREREHHCRERAGECSSAEARSTYLGFAARYAALASSLEGGGPDPHVTLRLV